MTLAVATSSRHHIQIHGRRHSHLPPLTPASSSKSNCDVITYLRAQAPAGIFPEEGNPRGLTKVTYFSARWRRERKFSRFFSTCLMWARRRERKFLGYLARTERMTSSFSNSGGGSNYSSSSDFHVSEKLWFHVHRFRTMKSFKNTSMNSSTTSLLQIRLSPRNRTRHPVCKTI